MGKKLEMTQKFAPDGTVTPVTVVAAGPCTVTQVKTAAKDGYTAVQVGFGAKKRLTKALTGHLKDLSPFAHLREFRLADTAEIKRGDVVSVEQFTPGDVVTVTGVAKGKGFQGVVKRHKFHGHPASHGHKDQLRTSGSIGAGGVQHVMKGMRMAGRMGGQQVTVHNLKVVDVDTQRGLLYIQGALPGPRNAVVEITVTRPASAA